MCLSSSLHTIKFFPADGRVVSIQNSLFGRRKKVKFTPQMAEGYSFFCFKCAVFTLTSQHRDTINIFPYRWLSCIHSSILGAAISCFLYDSDKLPIPSFLPSFSLTCFAILLTSFKGPVVHGAMGCGQKNFQLVWRCHQLLSGFLAKGHLP